MLSSKTHVNSSCLTFLCCGWGVLLAGVLGVSLVVGGGGAWLRLRGYCFNGSV